jgi:lipid-A-disaccharide synthase-like uncharacterized protein
VRSEQLWQIIGFLGQGLFFSRLLVQWIASERRRASTVPAAFWALSLAGGSSSSLRPVPSRPGPGDRQAGGLLIYARNLWLLHRPRDAAR